MKSLFFFFMKVIPVPTEAFRVQAARESKKTSLGMFLVDNKVGNCTT